MRRTSAYIFPAVLIFSMLSSCSTERELARDFLNRKDSIAVLLIPPDFVFKTNLKAYEIENFDSLNEVQQDSALLANSDFLTEINDTLLVKRLFSSLQAGLSQYGIQSFSRDQLTEFMNLDSPAYQVSLVQLEVEEDVYPYRAEEVFFDTVLYFEDFLLDKVSLNHWFDVSKLNDPDAVNHVLYASHFVMDALEGRFVSNAFTRDVKFKYNLDDMQVEDIYALASMLGEKYAGYLFDYLLNEYIFRNYPEDTGPNVYLHYDRQNKTIYPARDDRFIFMDE